MSSGLKFMGKGPDGNAKGIAVNEKGDTKVESVNRIIVKDIEIQAGERVNIGEINMGTGWGDYRTVDISNYWKAIIIVDTRADINSFSIEHVQKIDHGFGNIDNGPMRFISDNLNDYEHTDANYGRYYEVPAIGDELAIRVTNTSDETKVIRAVVFKLI